MFIVYSDFLSKNRTVKLKLESLQITGSFKLRGALNKLLSLSEDQKKKGVVACSTGNHGKGVAYAASVLGISSTIYMSSMVPQYRKEAIEALGANVEIVGKNSDEGAAGIYTESGKLIISTAPDTLNDSVSLCHETGAYCEAYKIDEKIVASVCVHQGGDGKNIVLIETGIGDKCSKGSLNK